MIDTEEDHSIAAVDGGCIDTYVEPSLAVGNGFMQSTQIRCSTKWAQDRATKLASLSKWSPPRKLEWQARPSPLCQVTLASDVEPRLRRKPGRVLLRVEQEPSSSSAALPLLSASSTPSSTPLSPPDPSSLPSPLPSHSCSPLSSPPSTPPASASPPISARCPTYSTPSPTVSPSASGEPSRDPNTYWSFPSPNLAGSKARKSLRVALKKGFKTFLSAVAIRKSSAIKVS